MRTFHPQLLQKARRQTEYKDLPISDVRIELKAKGEGGTFRFKGYGSVWGRVDSYGDTIQKGAFSDALKTRLPIMLYSHRMDRVPGKWISAVEDEHGLLLEGELTPGHSEAADLEASLRHQSITGLSIGGYTKAADWIEEEGQIIGRRIKEFDLYEVSPVALPAEDAARVLGASLKAALAECETIRQVEAYLREGLGFSRGEAEHLISRVRDLSRGEPAAGSGTELSGFLETARSIQIPSSLLGD